MKKVRIGAVSCTYNTSLVDNVRRLAPYVDDIELILYEFDKDSNYPGPGEIAELKELAANYDLTYTVHLPSELGPHRVDLEWGRAAIDRWRRTIEASLALEPKAYIWHWEGEQWGWQPSADLERWLTCTLEIAESFLKCHLVASELLCVENLSYDYRLIAPHVEELGLSRCFDVGHAWATRRFSSSYLRECVAQARVFHLHGVSSGKDHIALQPENGADLHEFVKNLILCQGEPIVTLEVFSWKDWFESSCSLKRALKGII